MANEIRIRIIADSSGVTQGTTEAEGVLSSSFGKLKGWAVAGYAAAGAAALKFGKESVDAAMEAEKAQRALEGAYKRFPAVQNVSMQALTDLADAQMKATAFDDDAVKAGMAKLAMFDLTGKQIMGLTPLMLDYAQKTGKDIPTAATTLGKAMLGNTRALKELGISYTATGDKATDLANIQAMLQAKIGGAAAGYAQTTEGKLKQVGVAFGELKESVGAALLPIIQQLAPLLIKLMQILAPVLEWVGNNIQYVAAAMVILGGPITATIGLVILLVKYWDEIVVVLGAVWGALQTLWGIIVQVGQVIWQLIQVYLTPLRTIISVVAALIRGDWVGALEALAAPFQTLISWIEKALGWIGKLKGAWDGVKGFIGSLNPFSAEGGAGAAPLPGVSTFGAPTLPGASGGRAITLNVNVNGNVGDPATVGRRAVQALQAYVATAGNRDIRALVG